jgi:1,4-dihydroxy-6-naphthoate synthase
MHHTLTIGFSTCPNDTFIFDALVNQQIDIGNLRFNVVLEDVQTLNEWALEGKLDISKISYGVLPLLLSNYQLLPSGGALGKGVGPLLIAKNKPNLPIESLRVAIPGKNTTAHLLFSLAYPLAQRKEFMVFSDIEQAVLEEKVDLGVIIHENRFTYQQKGLLKIVDLGTYWEEQTKNPIPLGGIVIKKTIERTVQQSIHRFIQQSLQHAFAQYPTVTNYVKQHAQEMDEVVMQQHINLYVNNYSLHMGEEGKAAVLKLITIYDQLNNTQTSTSQLFMQES